MWPTTIVTSWVDAFFPQRCALCRCQSVHHLCDACAAQCPEIGTHCRTCAREMAERDRQCGACLRRPPMIDALYVRWRYRDRVRALVLNGGTIRDDRDESVNRFGFGASGLSSCDTNRPDEEVPTFDPSRLSIGT